MSSSMPRGCATVAKTFISWWSPATSLSAWPVLSATQLLSRTLHTSPSQWTLCAPDERRWAKYGTAPMHSGADTHRSVPYNNLLAARAKPRPKQSNETLSPDNDPGDIHRAKHLVEASGSTTRSLGFHIYQPIFRRCLVADFQS